MFSWLAPTSSAPRVPSPLRTWLRRKPSVAAQGHIAGASGISTPPGVPVPAKNLKIYTVELALRGISVHVTGTAESEWHACSSIMRRWPDARFVAVWEGSR